MSWNFDWSVVGEAITNLIHQVGKAIDIIIETIKITFP